MTAKGYFFDFDGTLVDSMDPAIDALLGFLRERGVRYPENIVEIMLPLGYKGIASYFSDAFGIPKRFISYAATHIIMVLPAPTSWSQIPPPFCLIIQMASFCEGYRSS